MMWFLDEIKQNSNLTGGEVREEEPRPDEPAFEQIDDVQFETQLDVADQDDSVLGSADAGEDGSDHQQPVHGDPEDYKKLLKSIPAKYIWNELLERVPECIKELRLIHDEGKHPGQPCDTELQFPCATLVPASPSSNTANSLHSSDDLPMSVEQQCIAEYQAGFDSHKFAETELESLDPAIPALNKEIDRIGLSKEEGEKVHKIYNQLTKPADFVLNATYSHKHCIDSYITLYRAGYTDFAATVLDVTKRTDQLGCVPYWPKPEFECLRRIIQWLPKEAPLYKSADALLSRIWKSDNCYGAMAVYNDPDYEKMACKINWYALPGPPEDKYDAKDVNDTFNEKNLHIREGENASKSVQLLGNQTQPCMQETVDKTIDQKEQSGRDSAKIDQHEARQSAPVENTPSQSTKKRKGRPAKHSASVDPTPSQSTKKRKHHQAEQPSVTPTKRRRGRGAKKPRAV